MRLRARCLSNGLTYVGCPNRGHGNAPLKSHKECLIESELLNEKILNKQVPPLWVNRNKPKSKNCPKGVLPNEHGEIKRSTLIEWLRILGSAADPRNLGRCGPGLRARCLCNAPPKTTDAGRREAQLGRAGTVGTADYRSKSERNVIRCRWMLMRSGAKWMNTVSASCGSTCAADTITAAQFESFCSTFRRLEVQPEYGRHAISISSSWSYRYWAREEGLMYSIGRKEGKRLYFECWFTETNWIFCCDCDYKYPN
uniref:SCP domain-containing protein n=1 Tax=Steinernema glaseri TaxID=37863 RepID=A0A1I8A823_9BILA